MGTFLVYFYPNLSSFLVRLYRIIYWLANRCFYHHLYSLDQEKSLMNLWISETNDVDNDVRLEISVMKEKTNEKFLGWGENERSFDILIDLSMDQSSFSLIIFVVWWLKHRYSCLTPLMCDLFFSLRLSLMDVDLSRVESSRAWVEDCLSANASHQEYCLCSDSLDNYSSRMGDRWRPFALNLVVFCVHVDRWKIFSLSLFIHLLSIPKMFIRNIQRRTSPTQPLWWWRWWSLSSVQSDWRCLFWF